MTNIAATPMPTTTTDEIDTDALFEIDDVDTPLYSSSCNSVPSLMADTNLSDDDDDLFEVEDDENTYCNQQQQQQQLHTSWNPTLLSPLLQPKSIQQSKRSSLSFDSVLINSPPTKKNSSVTEQNYKIWLSTN
ncbi:hypothetical protein CANINC_004791 [Pichia inconspicua]|uniref:Uncharacterized protein n=1 Tax=Pichia inconspicua TaxID=52247 RepID=A0A4T0WVD3_9ASCO|nr:hypothetical protein CANINC_004791 [[Candida] inconspicua]